ncbi:MAG TPA: hypothetical protein VND97_05300, partial [Beijerinckiaceae bacterium]|nr:hypothetical protein [Beijerinckiaceae bacterium]
MFGRFSTHRVTSAANAEVIPPPLPPLPPEMDFVNFAPPPPPPLPAPPVVLAPSEPAPGPPATSLLHSPKLLDAKVRLHRKLLEDINLAAMEKLSPEEVRPQIHELVAQYVLKERLALTAQELSDFVSEIIDEMIGLGPIEPLLRD